MRLTFDCYLELSADKSLPGHFDARAKFPDGQKLDRGAWLRIRPLDRLVVDQDLPPGELNYAAILIAESMADQGMPGWRDFGKVFVRLVENGKSEPLHGVCESQNHAVLCPDCQSPMIRRKSQRGPFWGCSRYSDGCRGIRPISQ